jgi:hypothetical protein
MIKRHSSMESKRILITNKIPGAYHESAYIMDYLDTALTVKVKSFKAEINILRNCYLCGSPDRWTASYISGEILRCTTTWLKMEPGNVYLQRKTRSFHSQPKWLKCGIISSSEGVADCISRSSKGDNTASYSLDEFDQDIKHPHGFTSSFADGDTEHLNWQVHFDTDSVFFVCDNSTTGHICNDLCKFIPGSLCQTNKSLTTANGTGPCLQEGTVQINLNNDDGQ